MNPPGRSRVRGSLLGAAVGDALGAPIAFEALEEIRGRFGPRGLQEPAAAFGRTGAVSAGTQLMLFTAEGLLLAAADPALAGRSGVVRSVHRACLRWLRAQGERSTHATFERSLEGRLLGIAELQQRRAPDDICLSALRVQRMGRIQQPLNSHDGCGALLRAVPVGLAREIDDPFGTATEVSALTHGHPAACLACGFLARVVREVSTGTCLDTACREGLEELGRHPGSERCSSALERALSLSGGGEVSARHIHSLGPGRTAAGALAIGALCALATTDVARGLRGAVNHDGDSSTCAAVAGCLLGAAHGAESIPARWLEVLELRGEIQRLAAELGRPPGARAQISS
jgi:ADP-ribosylglycohydrolase